MGHSKGQEVFRVTEAVAESPDVLVCKLVAGKVTCLHRRLWPALVKLVSRFQKAQLAKVWNEHTPSGSHRLRTIAFPDWVPSDAFLDAERLTIADAEQMLSPWLEFGGSTSKVPCSDGPAETDD